MRGGGAGSRVEGAGQKWNSILVGSRQRPHGGRLADLRGGPTEGLRVPSVVRVAKGESGQDQSAQG